VTDAEPERLFLERWPDEADKHDAIHYESCGYGIDEQGFESDIHVYVREDVAFRAAKKHNEDCDRELERVKAEAAGLRDTLEQEETLRSAWAKRSASLEAELAAARERIGELTNKTRNGLSQETIDTLRALTNWCEKRAASFLHDGSTRAKYRAGEARVIGAMIESLSEAETEEFVCAELRTMRAALSPTPESENP
jgi:hypothetical protein